jgi:hypothetical protein
MSFAALFATLATLAAATFFTGVTVLLPFPWNLSKEWRIKNQ